MLIKIYLIAQRFENYDYEKRNIENPYWKPEGKKVFEIEIDSELLNSELLYETNRNKVFSNIVESYSDDYEKFEFLSYSFRPQVIQVNQQIIQRYL